MAFENMIERQRQYIAELAKTHENLSAQIAQLTEKRIQVSNEHEKAVASLTEFLALHPETPAPAIETGEPEILPCNNVYFTWEVIDKAHWVQPTKEVARAKGADLMAYDKARRVVAYLRYDTAVRLWSVMIRDVHGFFVTMPYRFRDPEHGKACVDGINAARGLY